MELLKNRSLFILICLTCFGFRTFKDSTPWDVSNTNSATVKLFVKYDKAQTSVKNDLSSSDPLGSSGSTLTVEQLMDSIFDDINGINAAFISLVDMDDPDYANYKNKREITISFSGASGGNAGEAKFEVDDDKFVSCTIKGKSDLLDSAEKFVGTITHELGHCLGLDHPQESVNSVMSYYRYDDMVRLQSDDKMALIYLYPVDKSAAEEDFTLGLSCSRR